MGASFAQTFDIDQATQLIRPRIKTEARYIFDSDFRDTSGKFNSFDQSVSFTFPIKRKFGTDINLNLKSLKIKDIIKNSVRIKAYEVLGTARITSRQLQLGFDSIPSRNLFGFNAGLIGLHLTRKYRIAFYSLNVFLQEDIKTIPTLVPRFSALGGQYHIRGIKKSFYYGAALIYSDGLLIPAPFVGGTENLGGHWYFNYTLPVQLNIQYQNEKHNVLAGIKADGFRSSILLKGKRNGFNYTQGSVFGSYRYRFSNTFYAQAECGYIFYQNILLDKNPVYRNQYGLKGTPYINAGFYAYFGKSLLEKIVEQLF
jgi:hypothetical protein